MNLTSTSISASAARNNFYTILDNISRKLERVTVTRNGKAQAVLIHPDEVAAWEETMEVLSDKRVIAQILKSEIERKNGNTTSEKKLLEELGISSNDIKT